MKNHILCLMLIMVLMITTSCQSLNNIDNSTVSMKNGTITSDFSMLVPEDYEETSSDYIEKYFIKDNSASIIVTNEKNTHGYTTAKDYYNYAIQQYSSTFDNFQEISSQITSVSDKYDAIISEFSYEITSENGIISMTCYTEYILVGSNIYIVTCSSPTDTYSNYKDGFVQSVNSVIIHI